MNNKSIFSLAIFFCGLLSFAQTAKIKGLVLNENQELISDVSITVGNESTSTNKNGFYELEVPSNEEIRIYYSHLGYQTVILIENLRKIQSKNRTTCRTGNW